MSTKAAEMVRAFEPLARTGGGKAHNSRRSWRARLSSILEAEVEESVNNEVAILEEDDGQVVECWGSPCVIGGQFCYAGDDTIEVELEGDAAAAWYIERPTSFDGSHEGCDWHATVRRHVRRRRYLTLVLDIEAR